MINKSVLFVFPLVSRTELSKKTQYFGQIKIKIHFLKITLKKVNLNFNRYFFTVESLMLSKRRHMTSFDFDDVI